MTLAWRSPPLVLGPWWSCGSTARLSVSSLPLGSLPAVLAYSNVVAVEGARGKPRGMRKAHVGSAHWMAGCMGSDDKRFKVGMKIDKNKTSLCAQCRLQPFEFYTLRSV